jgi:hypothetical protein
VCSTALDCSRTVDTVALSAVQKNDRLLFTGPTKALTSVHYNDRLLFYWCFSALSGV